MGGAGDSPAPVGDPPTGIALGHVAKRPFSLARTVVSVPSGGSPVCVYRYSAAARTATPVAQTGSLLCRGLVIRWRRPTASRRNSRLPICATRNRRGPRRFGQLVIDFRGCATGVGNKVNTHSALGAEREWTKSRRDG